MKTLKALLIIYFAIVSLSCQNNSIKKVKYALTFANKDKDTIVYIGIYKSEKLDKGDLAIIIDDLNYKTIASGVRTYNIISCKIMKK